MVRVRLLGGLALEVDGDRPSAPASRRARSLLAWLALHPGDHPRADVAARFWPDVLDSSARTSLRGALLELRRALGPGADCLRSGRATVGLDHGDCVWVDALEVQRLAAAGELEQALELGADELLPGLDDEWVYLARDEHRDRMVEIAGKLVERAHETGDTAAAVAFSRRQVALDPVSEDAHRNLIRALAAAGDRPAALKAYDGLRERLRRELGVAPDASTRELVERLRDGAPAEPGDRLPLPPAVPAHSDEMVGRRGEVRDLESALAAVSEGEARVVLVAGEAGMGKTRLTSEFARSAHAGGATVLFGRCDEEVLAPYQPWVEALRHHVAHANADDLRHFLGVTAPELARVIPTLATRLPGLPQPVRAEPDTERYRLFEAVAGLLSGIAASAPTVVVLDDLHWADKPTVLLLRHIVRSASDARILIVGTYRENEVDREDPLGQALAELHRDPAYSRLALTGLPEEDVATLVDRGPGPAASEEFVRALHQETEGNPFFIGEILRSGETRLPDGVKEAIGRRLRPLSEPARRTLTVAAIVGSEFDFALLDAMGTAGAELADALDEAVRTQLIIETGDAAGRYSFRHALIRATLDEELTRTQRARLHLAVGDALERLSGPSSSPPYGELAHHYLEAAALGGATQAIRYSVMAAERASAQLAFEEAVGHLRRALTVLADDDSTSAERTALLIALGEAEARAGETVRARAAFGQAARGAREANDSDSLALAALGFAGHTWQSFGEVDTDAIELLSAGLNQLTPGDSALRARTLARLAVALYFAGDQDQIDAMTVDALAMARRVGEPAAVATAIEARLYALWHPDGLDERLEAATELLQVAERAGRPELAAQAHRWRIVALLELPRLEEATAEIEAHAELARTLGQPYELMYTKVFDGMRALFTGAFGEAARLAEEILSSEHGRPGADALQFYGLHMLTLTHACGGIEELEKPIGDFIERYPGIPAWRASMPVILAESGQLDEARAQFARVAQNDFAIFLKDVNWYPSMAWNALTCRDVGEPEQAAALYRKMLPYDGRALVIGAGGAVWGSFRLYLGITAARAGDAEAARQHLEEEIDWAESNGARPWVAQAQVALAEVLEEPALLEQAAATAAELGMTALTRRIGELRSAGSWLRAAG